MTLGEICKIQSWKARPKSKWLFPVYWGNGILGYADDFNVEDDMIIIGRVGAYCGCVYFENNKFWLSDNALGLVNNEKSDIKFLYYFLINQNLNKKSIWGAQPLLTQWILNGIEIIIPSDPKEQHAIAAVLSSFDDKIELLREENKTLEATAQAIFKEWFGKYNIDDELPEGWKVGKLGDVIDLQWWFVHDTQASWKAISKIAKMWVVNWKDWFNRDSVIDYSEEIAEKHKLQEDDLIVCTRDVTQDRIVIGNVAIVPKDLADFGLYAGSNTWIIKTNLNKYFLFLMLRDQEFRNHIIQSAKWSTIVMITKDAFLNRDVVIPKKDFVEDLMSKITPIFWKIKNNHSQIQSLSKARDTLLPKLMKGEMRVEF